jgi:glutamine amidotransferase
MCRLLGYFGAPVPLDHLFYKPEHSLIQQSYQPREMTAGLLNADGFGVGWYHAQRQVEPFLYKNTLPIWNDVNLPSLSRYVESGCVLANVRSATLNLSVDLSNCQPFQSSQILGVHNGFIDNFRQTLYRPIRDRLSDEIYQTIQGRTDSEHIFALLLQELQASSLSLVEAVEKAIAILCELAKEYATDFSANLIISDGKQLVASRYASRDPVPSLYWLRDDPLFPNAVLIASEPLFDSHWIPFRDRSILTVAHDLTIETHAL